MRCGVGYRHGLDLALLWLWHRLVATTPIRPLAWEPLYASGVALEKAKKTKYIYICVCVCICMYIYVHHVALGHVTMGILAARVVSFAGHYISFKG